MQPQPQHQPSLPPNWSCHRTPQGQPYFHNHVTGETTWTPPQPQSSPPSTQESAAAPEHTPAPAAATVPAAISVPAAAPAPAPFPSAHPSITNVNRNSMSPQMAHAPSNVAHQSALSYTMESLVAKNRVKGGAGTALMELERSKLLRLNIGTGRDSYAWVRHGCMIARRGDIKIRRQGMRDQGLGRLVKKAVTGEGVTLVKCEGRGVVFCADQGKIVSLVFLNNQTLYLNGNDVLALSVSLNYDIKLMKGANMAAGGLFNVSVSGTGMLAFTCHHEVVTLRATPQDPVYSDPDATVAWTHQPTLKMDVNLKAFIGRSTGEEFQLQFNDGYVVVQPFEEVSAGSAASF